MADFTLYAQDANPVPGATYPQMSQQGTAVGINTLRFDATTDEACQWPVQFPGYTSGNVTVEAWWHAEASTTGGVLCGASLCVQGPTDDIDSTTDAWATENTGSDTHQGTTTKRPHSFTITISNLDTLAATKRAFLRFRRLGSDTVTDTMGSDMHLDRLVVTYSTA